MATISGQWVHMVGIAGAGMSGIAKILLEQGYKVSGSDLQSNSITTNLVELGIEIHQGHSSSNVKEGVDLLVVSSAIPQDNPEVKMARERKIPVLKRGQMLANLVNAKKGVAVAGAHGKTTTTSMVYAVMAGCGLDPSFIVGGELQGTNLNAKLGSGDYFVVEADESDASFLDLKPYIAIVTNIEDDHLDYYKSLQSIQDAFKQFLEEVKPDGFAVVYGEDAYIQTVKEETTTELVFYGEKENNDYYMINWQVEGKGSRFDVYHKGTYLGEIKIVLPGKYNALNALATIATALEVGLEFEEVAQALYGFNGAKRRFQVLGKKGRITVVDDYAHHPTEIRAAIDAAQQIHSGRVVVVFQPHRYSRTKMLGKQLGEALEKADLVILTDIYTAGERPIPGISAQLIYEAARAAGSNVTYISSFSEIEEYLIKYTRENDLIITMGAGDIWKLGLSILDKLP